MFRLNMWTRPFMPPPATPPLGLEGSPYLQGPLTSPALMVLASTADSAAREAAGHGFEQKAAGESGAVLPGLASFPAGYRPGEPFPSLYSPLHPPFLRPGLGFFSHTSSGAFRPVASPTEAERDAYGSAFLPAKKPKLEGDDVMDKPTDLSRSAATSTSPPERRTPHDTSSEVLSDGGSPHDRNTPDSSGTGNRRCTVDEKPTSCPVCGEVLAPSDLELHLQQELEYLQETSLKKEMVSPKINQSPTQHRSHTGQHLAADSPIQQRFDAYLRIKQNRYTRTGAKKRKRRHTEDCVACPTCQQKISGSPEDIQAHTEHCGKKLHTIDMDGSFDNMKLARRLNNRFGKVEEEDVNVDGDDSTLYGGAQYTEADVVARCDAAASDGRDPASHTLGADKENQPSCVVCKGNGVRRPVVSVTCWHVHCEDCWLRTLSTKKLCPQCNVITSPADLRKLHF